MIRFTTCALALLLPGGLVAQELEIAPFGSRNRGLQDAPTLVGLAATWYPLAVGVRASGAMDVASSPLSSLVSDLPSSGVKAWSGDLDLVLSSRRAGVPLGDLDTRVFAGVGIHGLRWPDGLQASAMVWSYGVGVSLPLARRLSVEVEGRYRIPNDPRPERVALGVGGGWEYRGGLSLRLGSPPTRTPPVGRAPGPYAGPAGVPAPPVATAALSRSMIRVGHEHLGIRYVWGGSSPAEGFDCSGFVQYVYARNGIRLPRVSRDQARAGRGVTPSFSNLQEGDLLFFASNGVIDHVAIYAGNGTILHASSRRGAVVYDRLDSPAARWYVQNLVAVRRVIP
jgi:cell wall-associated NlpC family hydrolase